MINFNLYIFVNRSFLWMLGRFFESRFNPLSMWKTFLHCFGGFLIISIFVWTGVLYSQTPSKLDQASKNKNEFIKYERGKSLIQREHPSNDQLLSTRQGLHSIPNNPAIPKGVVIDRTISIVCCFNQGYILSMNPLLGMNDREGMFNN